MANKSRTLTIVAGFMLLIVVLGVLIYMLSARTSVPLVLLNAQLLGTFSRSIRVSDLDATFRDAIRGKRQDVDMEYSGGMLYLTATVDVRQGSCTLYTTEGSVRFEAANVSVVQIAGSPDERRLAGTGHAAQPFCIMLEPDAQGKASGTLRIYDGSEGSSANEKHCWQPLAVRDRTSSHVVRLTFMLSQDFQGEVHDWRLSRAK